MARKALVLVLGFLFAITNVAKAKQNRLQTGGDFTDLETTNSTDVSYDKEKPCPIWWHHHKGSCVCGNSLDDVIHCDLDTNQTSILVCNCMTARRNSTSGVLQPFAGACIYSCFARYSYTSKDTVYQIVPPHITQLNNQTCGLLNREGTLCGDCRPGHYLAPYTYDLQCFDCTYSPWNWAWYIAVAYGPLTVFFIIMVSCRISVISGPLTAFVNFSQLISGSLNLRVILAAVESSAEVSWTRWSVRILATLYGVWNLDFFRTLVPPICLNVTSLQATALDYGIAVYPLILIVMTYILVELHERNFRLVVWVWRPFHMCFTHLRNRWEVRTSIIDAFATFFFLSFMKILSVSSDILVYGKLYNQNGIDVSRHLYYYASVEYFGKEHLPYAVTAIIVLTTFIFFPLVFLLLYPLQTFQRLLHRCRLRTRTLTTFIDSIQGCYKDGTNGTCDCRYFSTMYIFIRLVMVAVYTFTLDVYFYSLATLLAVIVAVMYFVFKPYKNSKYNKLDVMLLLNMAVWCASIVALSIASVKSPYFTQFSVFLVAISSIGPLLYIAVLIPYWIVARKRLPQRILLRAGRHFRGPNFRIGETFDTSLPHRLLYPNEYNHAAPLASQESLVDEVGNVQGSDADSASDCTSEELWSVHGTSEEDSDTRY